MRDLNSLIPPNGLYTLTFANAINDAGQIVVTASKQGERRSSRALLLTPVAGSFVSPAPQGLTAKAGSGRVTLQWQASAGATSYTLKRYALSGGPYAVIATNIKTLSYVDTTVSAQTDYYYVIAADNAYGESRDSSEAHARTP